MTHKKHNMLENIGCILVLLMTLVQGAYAIYGYVDPLAFSILRGTELFANGDSDWVKIYASRTLFVALISGYLLYSRQYKILMWAALFAAVMPITDALLAYQANAPLKVILKHVATIVYLIVTFFVLRIVVKYQEIPKNV